MQADSSRCIWYRVPISAKGGRLALGPASCLGIAGELREAVRTPKIDGYLLRFRNTRITLELSSGHSDLLIQSAATCSSNRNENNLVEDQPRDDGSGDQHDEAKSPCKIKCHGGHGPDNSQ